MYVCLSAYLYACVHRVSVGMALGPVVLSLLYEANGGSFRQPLLLLARHTNTGLVQVLEFMLTPELIMTNVETI